MTFTSFATIQAFKPDIRPATGEITFKERWDHFMARLGVNREQHRVEPGLYSIGSPTPESPVFVTANYTLSFDALRSALIGRDGYMLVLDTKGINVWCAAGKGTFGTDELVARVHATALREVVTHRRLILPQLGAVGVAAHKVKKGCGFKVIYGPVRADDLPKFLDTGECTPEMRRVTFPLMDRIVLIPVEVKHYFIPMLIGLAATLLLLGKMAALATVVAYMTGLAAFPMLLPWLPHKDFSVKGYILGVAVCLPFALNALGSADHMGMAWALAYALTVPSVVAYLALNFTGSTTFTSVTGVKKEIAHYVPIMAWTCGAGLVIALVLTVVEWMS